MSREAPHLEAAKEIILLVASGVVDSRPSTGSRAAPLVAALLRAIKVVGPPEAEAVDREAPEDLLMETRAAILAVTLMVIQVSQAEATLTEMTDDGKQGGFLTRCSRPATRRPTRSRLASSRTP